ncbi:MAG TPA: DinB family protein [Vicinamibacterales bacterium]|nr:DinB family protein [Vicinamibacterales bacterium]
MDLQTRQSLVARYKEGYRAVTDALQGATEAELDARPAPGKWTAREIVHHLADSEMQSAFRLRHMLASEKPAIAAYDQDEFARKLHYDRPIAASLSAFKAARETTAELLDRMADADWSRLGTHPEHTDYGVEKWLRIYAAHAHDHADQIRRARASVKRG